MNFGHLSSLDLMTLIPFSMSQKNLVILPKPNAIWNSEKLADELRAARKIGKPCTHMAQSDREPQL